MNILLWVLQILAALMYAASGFMKVFMFDKISADVRSFGALPKGIWSALGMLEMICAVALVLPACLHGHAQWTWMAAIVLALESLVFIGVHARYREIGTIVMCAVLGVLMAFVAYGRMVLVPLS
jgi:uncharacterized membrane protein YphA (DoxX/SURF4 family)